MARMAFMVWAAGLLLLAALNSNRAATAALHVGQRSRGRYGQCSGNRAVHQIVIRRLAQNRLPRVLIAARAGLLSRRRRRRGRWGCVGGVVSSGARAGRDRPGAQQVYSDGTRLTAGE